MSEFIWMIILFLVGVGTIAMMADNEIYDLKAQAIEHGCAIHDPKTGAFTWKEGKS